MKKKIIAIFKNIAMHNNFDSKKNLAEIAFYYESGMPITQMQEVLGISKKKLHMYLNKLAFVFPYTFLLADSKRSLKLETH